MTAFWISCAVLAAITSLVRTTLADLQLAFPINSQVPPVAYVAKSYEFVFAATTFDNDGSEIAYSLVGNPSWLQIESASRKFSGTPSAGDAGAPSFSLVATDQTGQKTSSVTLVVLQTTTISVGADVLSQLQAQGNATSPASLLYYPLQSFSIGFTRDTFVGTSAQTNYYATSIDGSPLPSWIQFDTADLRFHGNAPPLLQPPPAQQQYSFSLAASNVVGFSETSVSFSVITGNNLLSFNPPSISASASAGSVLRLASLLPSLLMDGKSVARSDLSSVTTTAPGWLVLNTADISLAGTPPQGVSSGTFNIIAKSDTSNAANLTVTYTILSGSGPDQFNLGTFDASLGSNIAYQIQIPSGLNVTHQATAALGSLSSWLVFSSSDFTMRGHVPASAQSARYPILITFNKVSGGTVTGNLTVNIIANGTISNASGGTTGSTSSATSDSTAGITGLSRSKSHTTKLVLAILVPIVAVLIIVCLGLLFLQIRDKKRQKAQAYTEPNMTPLPSAQMLLDRSQEMLPPRISRPQTSHSSRHNGPPRLELPWAPDSMKGARKRLSKRPKTSHSSEIGASWDDLIGRPAPSTQSHEALPLSTSDVPPMPVIDYSKPFSRVSPTVHKKKSGRLDRKLARDTFQSRVSKAPRMSVTQPVGLPKRASGAGHGTIISNSSFNPQRSSWQTTFGTILQLESRPNTILLERFPSPPSSQTLHRGQVEAEPKLTLRVVSPEGNHYEGDVEAARLAHTKKAQDKLEGASKSSQAAAITADVDGSTLPVEEMVQPPPVPPTRIRPTLSINLPADINHLNAPAGLSPRQLTPTSLSNYSHSPGASPVMSSGALNSFTYPPQSPFESVTSPIHQKQHNRNHTSTSFPRSLHRLTSTASSRQFDSAMSSDSQWEDDEPIPEEPDHRPTPSAPTQPPQSQHTQLPQSTQSPPTNQFHHQQQHDDHQYPQTQEDRRPSSASIILHQHHHHHPNPGNHTKNQSLTRPPHTLTLPPPFRLPQPPTPIPPLFSRPNFHLNTFAPNSNAAANVNANLTSTIIMPVSPTTAVNMSHANANASGTSNRATNAGFAIYEDAPSPSSSPRPHPPYQHDDTGIFDDAEDIHSHHASSRNRDRGTGTGTGTRTRTKTDSNRGKEKSKERGQERGTDGNGNGNGSDNSSRSLSLSRKRRVLTGLSTASGGASAAAAAAGVGVGGAGDGSSDRSYRFL